MKMKKYWIGLPICFIALVGGTYLIPKTYESSFVIVKESEQAVEHNRVMTLNHPENYDLGMIRTDNMLRADSYEKIIQSDCFLHSLLDVPVRTIDGDFEGSIADYYTKDEKKGKVKKTIEDELIPWKNIEQEQVKDILLQAIQVTYDYETGCVTVRYRTTDPLVATMIATAIQEQLRTYIEAYQQDKMQQTLAQLRAAVEQAKADYEHNPSVENEAIYKSFARQEVVYRAQMVYSPAFAVLSNPSFSYRKVAPSRWKLPLLLTLLMGLGMLGWEYRKEIIAYLTV